MRSITGNTCIVYLNQSSWLHLNVYVDRAVISQMVYHFVLHFRQLASSLSSPLFGV